MLERIKELCVQSHTNFSQLEKQLGFVNGSLAKTKADKIQAMRVYQLAEFFNVTMEYLLTGENQSKALTDFEYRIILAYRKADDYDQTSVLRTLGIKKDADCTNSKIG